MSHRCHWPGCNREVPPKLWGCKEHWFTLPKRLRDKIWKTYRPGQEITKTPSAAYLRAAEEAQEWIQEHRYLEELADKIADSAQFEEEE